MGGKAVKNARRYLADEYFAKTAEILQKIRPLFPDSRFELIPAIRSKQDFGDADFLLESPLPTGWMEAIKAILFPTEVVHNGEVWSLNVDNLQVDIIVTPGYHFDFSLMYFSYNDVGNLVGRVAHTAEFKFGHKGLIKCLRDGNYLHDQVIVTRDFRQALKFIGYESGPYFYGFDTLESIFWYVTTSPYFDPYAYDLGNMSHTARVRDKKRPTYKSFLQWLDNQGFVGKPPEKTRTEEEWLNKALETFPEFATAWKASCTDMANKKVAKAKFNGRIVNELTGLQEKQLSEFMASFRIWIAEQNDNLFDFVFRSTDKEIRNKILEFMARRTEHEIQSTNS